MSFIRMSKKHLLLTLLLAVTFLLSACDSPTENYHPNYSTQPVNENSTLVLGVHPLFNPEKLFRVFTPLAEYLSQHLPGVHIVVEASKDYLAYDEKLQRNEFDLILPNPYQTVMAMKVGYEVIAKAGTDQQFRGIILVRKDSNIRQISDLKGKRISYPAPSALAATMMPQLFLVNHGLDIRTDTATYYVGSQESSMMNVYLKHTDAAATWPIPWQQLQRDKPLIADELRMAWQTETLPSISFMYLTRKINTDLAHNIQRLLLNLDPTQAEDRRILNGIGIEKFFSANNATYDPIKDFLQHFKNKIGDNASLAQSP